MSRKIVVFSLVLLSVISCKKRQQIPISYSIMYQTNKLVKTFEYRYKNKFTEDIEINSYGKLDRTTPAVVVYKVEKPESQKKVIEYLKLIKKEMRMKKFKIIFISQTVVMPDGTVKPSSDTGKNGRQIIVHLQ